MARYPLAALETLRRRHVDGARARLGAAVAEGIRLRGLTDAAGRALLDAGARLRAAEEGAREGAGCDLADGERWVERLRRRQRCLCEDAARCREASERSSALEEALRDALAAAERELRAVSRHRERWEGERRRRAQAAEEAE
ncbi:MAG TPA: hypothetical protein VLT61_18140, partial [Anaeromyxobacteraceae bacterium]|nr:hypothetical protein [Anaeromyxobacteraceae bacterium]